MGQRLPVKVRPGHTADLEGFYALAVAAAPGMTNLPPNRAALAAKLAATQAALSSAEARAGGAPLVFIIEHDGEVSGTACIFVRIGIEWPFYSYKLSRLAQTSKSLGKTVSLQVLNLVNDFDGCAEVGGLFIAPAARGTAAGRLAARSRYLFIAEHRDWFGERLISELRGVLDEAGRSPVWEALGRRFYGMSFVEAERTAAQYGGQFIADLGPKHPIYVNLLAPEAQAALGQPHKDGLRARDLLVEEGFRYESYVDIFDGGPTMITGIDALTAVRDSRLVRVGEIRAGLAGPERLISSGRAQAFRAAHGVILADGDQAVVEPALAEALELQTGDLIRHVLF